MREANQITEGREQRIYLRKNASNFIVMGSGNNASAFFILLAEERERTCGRMRRANLIADRKARRANLLAKEREE